MDFAGKSQQSQDAQIGSQVFLAMTVIVPKVIALVFERVERLILYFSTGSCQTNQFFYI